MSIPKIQALPIAVIRKVVIEENNEPLVEILESKRIKLLHEHKFLHPFLRKTICNMLVVAGENLPEGYSLLVVTAHRPIAMQRKLWKQRLWQLAKKYPLKAIFNPSGLKEFARKYTAPPGGSSHQCGAAVDLIVLDRDGTRLPMGTTLTDFGERCHTTCDTLTKEEKVNREILYTAMTRAGFINYPLEWWHYSYGDRMWAAYSGKDFAFYGPIQD